MLRCTLEKCRDIKVIMYCKLEKCRDVRIGITKQFNKECNKEYKILLR